MKKVLFSLILLSCSLLQADRSAPWEEYGVSQENPFVTLVNNGSTPITPFLNVVYLYTDGSQETARIQGQRIAPGQTSVLYVSPLHETPSENPLSSITIVTVGTENFERTIAHGARWSNWFSLTDTDIFTYFIKIC